MSKLKSIQFDDNSVIYIEAEEDIQSPAFSASVPTERSPVAKGGGNSTLQHFQSSIQDTIRIYTDHTLNAFRNLAGANVDKVTLEFGIKVGGEAGIPYVTKGTAESNIKITVECSFPKE